MRALLASRGPNNAVRIWDVDAGTEVSEFKGHEGAITAITFGPDGKTWLPAATTPRFWYGMWPV